VGGEPIGEPDSVTKTENAPEGEATVEKTPGEMTS